MPAVSIWSWICRRVSSSSLDRSCTKYVLGCSRRGSVGVDMTSCSFLLRTSPSPWTSERRQFLLLYCPTRRMVLGLAPIWIAYSWSSPTSFAPTQLGLRSGVHEQELCGDMIGD